MSVYFYVNRIVYSYEVNGVFIHGSIEFLRGEQQ